MVRVIHKVRHGMMAAATNVHVKMHLTTSTDVLQGKTFVKTDRLKLCSNYYMEDN